MDQFADLDNVVFEYTVGGRIGNHDGCEFFTVFLGLGFQFVHIDIARFGGAYDDHLHASHLRRGRIGTVCGSGDQADIAVAFIAALMVSLDRQQAGILTLRTRVGLQRYGVVSGTGAEHLLELDE
ncbi:hypothetical protein MnTg03_00083 [bacterium MnTg03]|nr:hypothetical protein MnTg03_00083 [bacterium MnTg03]